MSRTEEIRELLSLSAGQLRERAGGRLTVAPDIDALHRHMAESIFQEIVENNAEGRPTTLILPVGPTGQYPLLADMINEHDLDLSNCRFFFMDEYCGADGKAVSAEHPLSFKGEAERLFLGRLAPGLRPAADRVVFPDEGNIDRLAGLVEAAGGIDTCYGGIGIHGHVAFNEPEAGVGEMGPRRVRLNDFTVTINAVRSHVGGNLEGFPREAFTLGMREIRGARRVRLYCRNGCEFDWANTVLRLALLGEPGDDYPVTLLRDHPDTAFVTDEETATAPENVL